MCACNRVPHRANMTAYTVDADGRPRQRQVEHFNMCTLQANPTGAESDNGISIECFYISIQKFVFFVCNY